MDDSNITTTFDGNKMSLATESTPDAREVMDGGDLHRFSLLVEERLTLKATVAEAEARIKEMDAEITEMLTEAGTPRVMYGEATVALVSSRRSSLSTVRLVELGVSTSVIERATTVTAYSYLKVSLPRAQG